MDLTGQGPRWRLCGMFYCYVFLGSSCLDSLSVFPWSSQPSSFWRSCFNYYGVCLHLSLCDVSSWLDSGHLFFELLLFCNDHLFCTDSVHLMKWYILDLLSMLEARHPFPHQTSNWSVWCTSISSNCWLPILSSHSLFLLFSMYLLNRSIPR